MGQLLVKIGAVSITDIAEALEAQALIEHQHEKKMKIGEILLFDGRINLDQLGAALRLQVQRAERSRQRSIEAKHSQSIQVQKFGSRKKPIDKSFWGGIKRKFLKN